MNNKIILLFLLIFQLCFSQSNPLWKGYFSYNEIKDLTQSSSRFFAASENAVFSKQLENSEIKTLNTIDGLSSQTISAIYYSATANKTLIGYENGLLVVVDEKTENIVPIVAIIEKQIAPNIKKINHFEEFDGIIYVSCDFGIVQFDANTLQFGDTYFIGATKPEIIVRQTAIWNGFIFAATDEGLKKAVVSNPNLIDVNQWIIADTGVFDGVVGFGKSLFAAKANTTILKSSNGNTFTNFGATSISNVVDIRATTDFLAITTPNMVLVFDAQLALKKQIYNYQIPFQNTRFSCTTVLDNAIYIGTKENGVLSTNFDAFATFELNSPSGPSSNNMFSINANSSNIWAVYGGYSEFYVPKYNAKGFSKYNSEAGWINFPASIADAAVDLVRIAVDPSNENNIFISSYHSGLLRFENDLFKNHYDHTNSGLEALAFLSDPNYKSVRVEESVFDKNGKLWMTNSNIKNGLKSLSPSGQWQSFNLESVISKIDNSSIGKLTIDKNSTKWIATLNDGLIGFNENNNLLKKISSGSDSNSLPTTAVQAIAIDNRNQIWIGTRLGLRIISSVDSFLDSAPLVANPIIIDDNGIGQELMYNQFITDIVVDGANNKWIGTLGAGVFLFSSNGQETLQHFTNENSPLPSNNLNDIDINTTTGEVFFATDKGLVSYKGTAIKASENLENVLIYPNPVRPNFDGTVKITGLLNKANIKITDLEGNLVFEKIAEGGSIEWDTTAFGKYKVASGVYMIFIAAQDGIETKIKKIMIVR